MKLTHLVMLPFLIASLSCQILAQTMTWQDNYEKAHQLSKQNNKPILLFFSGSDWSGYAMQMKHEVLNAPSFQEKIGSHFYCIEIDFPQHTTLSPATLKQNEALKQRFHVREIPSLVLLDPEERIIAQIGYLPENGEQLAEDLIKIVEQDTQLIKALPQLDGNPDNLRKLYHIAQELGQQHAIEQILDKGIETEDSYFLLEKYRLLVENGEMRSPQASYLRNKIMSIEVESAQEIRFSLALIEFQQRSQSNMPPDQAIEPLTEYLSHYGQKDRSNTWRIEMMIAQLYMESDEQQKALLHAEKALNNAPESMHQEIAHSLDYIRKSSIK